MTSEETNELLVKMARVLEQGLQMDLNNNTCNISLCETCKLSKPDEFETLENDCKHYSYDSYYKDAPEDCKGMHYVYTSEDVR